MPKTKPFNEHYKQYEEWFLKNRYVYQSELRAVKHFIPPKGNGVEIGIGSGKFAEPLGIRIGVEPSKAMRKLARKKGIKVYNAVAEHLPFHDDWFDFALMVTTICFVDDIDITLQELLRIVKSTGYIIIGFVDRNSLLGKIYEKNKDKNIFYQDAIFYSATEVLDLLNDYGFKRLEIIQTVIGELPEINAVQNFKDGHGEGSFVVIRAIKE